MNKWLPAFLLTLACAASPAPAPVQAGTGIQRCQDADGQALYTDKPCRALGARPVPLPAELATRIVRERSHEQALSMAAFSTGAIDNAGAVETAVYADASAPLSLAPTHPASNRRPVAAGCARTPTQLQMDLRGAFALGDVNRIAESYHWIGVSHRGAMRILERLQSMARRQVVDTDYFDARISSGGGTVFASAGDSMVGGSGGILQVTLGDTKGGSIADFDVEHYRGCYFVRF